jgi:predicted ATPase/class 3 adenylate cyclase
VVTRDTSSVVELPAGTVTFVFTDIEGSTRLLHELGDEAYAEALAEHRRVVRAVFAPGREVDTQGDAFLYAFERASDAVVACSEVVAALDDGPIRVRIGVHTCEPILTEEGYVGVDLHRAARIAAAAHGGQVVVSQATRDLVSGVGLRDLGEHRLKDLAGPERLFQLGEMEFPPLRSLYRTNLPVPSWPLIGRERELAELERLVLSGRRLITLTGPGGSGKTRLAVQVAAELCDSFTDGVFFVALAPLEQVDLVPGAIAAALGFRADTDLTETLRSTRTLLVLDNTEHLVGVERFVSTLVEAVPTAVVLATSRSPLHLSAETEFALDPLSSDAACELFVTRAAATGRAVVMDDVVRAVCARVDDLPLAVELAAARTKVFSPADLLGHLEQALPLLVGGPRDAPERQQTLHATIAWSYELLDGAEKASFPRLAVFRGGFSLSAAEQVAMAGLDQIADLVDHSLLKAADNRFLMLETLREFALAQLSSDELTASRAAHADYYSAMAEREGPLLEGAELRQALERLEPELDNLRAALDWLIGNAEGEQFARMAAALWRFWLMRGLVHDGKHYASEALAVTQPISDEIRLGLLAGAFHSCVFLGEWDEAEPFGQQRAELARATGNDAELCVALNALPSVLHGRGELEPARAMGIEAVTLARELGDPGRLGGALHNLAVSEYVLGEHDKADAHLSEALEHWQTANSPRAIAHTRHNLGQIRIKQNRYEEAEALFRQTLPELLVLDKNIFAWALAGMSHLAWHQGDSIRAARLLARAEALHREIAYISPSVYLEIYERSRTDLHRARIRAEVEAAWLEGEDMTLDEALDYAIARPTTPSDPPDTGPPAGIP